MTQRFAPQDGSADLVAHPHRFTLRGDPASLAFPPLCANCGRAASERVAVSKVFRRTYSDSPTEHIVSSVEVPYCAACTQRHTAQTPPLTTWRKLLSSFATGDMLGAVFPALTALFFGYVALKDLVRGGDWVRFAFVFGFAAFLGLIAWYQRRHVWRATEHLRVPRQSEVSRAFDFSDDVSDAFESPRFVCTMRDASFAEAFAKLNADRRWIAGSPEAQVERRRAKRRLWLVGGIVAALALAGAIADWLGG
jgi:hypothetical protein